MSSTLRSKAAPALLDRLLLRAAAFGHDRPGLVALGVGLLCALAVVSGAGMTFRSELADLVPADVGASLQRLESAFGTTETAYLLLEVDSPGAEVALVAWGDSIVSELRASPLVRAARAGFGELETVLRDGKALSLAPLYAEGPELERLDRLLTPEGIREAVTKQAAQLGLPGIGSAESWIEKDPLELRSFIIPRLAALQGGLRVQAGSLHLLSEDGGSLLVQIDGKPKTSDLPGVHAAVDLILGSAERTRLALVQQHASLAGARARLTGGYAFAVEAESVLRRDLTLNTVLSLGSVWLLLAVTFRRPLVALVSMAPLAVGCVAGFALFSLLRREVVTLAFVSGAILAGLGIDYVTYLYVRVASDPGPLPAREKILDGVAATGRAMFFAAMTTAAAFLAFPLAGERFLADVGLLSACGILACFAATIVVLPAVLRPVLAGSRAPRIPRGLGAEGLVAPGLLWPRTTLFLAVGSAALALAYLVWSPPGLERDLRRLQPESSPAAEAQDAIAARYGAGDEPTLILLEAPGDSPAVGNAPGPAGLGAMAVAHALEGPLERLGREGVVGGWTSPERLLPRRETQEAALRILASRDAGSLEAALVSALDASGFAPESFAEARERLRSALSLRSPVGARELREVGLGTFLDRLVATPPGGALAILSVVPRAGLWHLDAQERFFQALEAAIEEVGARAEIVGARAISARSARGILREFLTVSGVAMAGVVLLVVFLFRRLLPCLLALLPVALGTLWMAVLCDLAGVRLNFMNVGILPMVLGTGVDIGIHLVQLKLENPDATVAYLYRRTGPSVMLAALTTLAGFGTLYFSTHPGLRSVGAVAGLGMLACLVASLSPLAAALSLWLPGREAPAGRGDGPSV